MVPTDFVIRGIFYPALRMVYVSIHTLQYYCTILLTSSFPSSSQQSRTFFAQAVYIHVTVVNMVDTEDNIPESGYGSVPLGRPYIRWDDLDDSNTRYERGIAAPSDEGLVRMWTGWAVLSIACGIVASVVFLAIVLKKKTRTNAFNVYILGLTGPDIVTSFNCGVICAANALARHFTTPTVCRFQSFSVVFAVCGNTWMNAVVAHEVHRLLRCSNRRQRYYPPTLPVVLRNTSLVYAICSVVSSMPLWPFGWVLVYVDVSVAGAGCVSILS